METKIQNKGVRLVVCFNDKAKTKIPITLENPDDVYLKKLNTEGYGIFETANSFYATQEQLKELAIKKKKKSVTKRNKEFLTRLNEVFGDLDVCKDGDNLQEEERERQKTLLKTAIDNYCPASTYIITKNGLQPRWWIDETGIDEPTQQKYVNVTNGIIEWSIQHGAKGDPVKDVTRVLRKPGYYHQKSKPYLIIEEKGNEKTYTLDELKEKFWSKPKVEEHNFVETRDDFVSNIDPIDIRQVASDVWAEKGHEATFDKDDHLIIDNVATATFVGREGSRNYMATTSSDYPAKGNAVTYVAETLGIDNKEAYKWLCKKYNLNPRNSFPEESIETIEKMLQQIPSDTDKVDLPKVVNPLLEKLINIDKIVAENFILYNVKDHFDITKEDAKKYIVRLNGLKAESIKKTKEEKKEPKLSLILDRDIDSQEAYGAISEIGILNMDTFKIITAVVISSQLRLNPPLWLLFIGVPSSFKTELVGLYEAMNEVFTLDTLSENAFSSGYVPPDNSEPKDLLPLLDNKSFVIKDLNTLFSMNEELVKKILGDLTSIFDGKFQKFTATRGLVEYHSLFSMIGCITPSILIKHYNYATQLGPRFFFLRVPELKEEEMEKSLERFWNETDRKNKIIKTRQIVSSYCAQMVGKIKQYKSKPETKEIQTKINNIAQFICKARGIAISNKTNFTNDKGEKVEYHEITDHQVEQPWRILNQLKALLRILSFINGHDVVGEEEVKMIRPVILSTMPVDRAEVLGVLAVKCGLSCKDISNEIGKSSKTIQRTMKELEAVGITDCYRNQEYNNSGKAPWLYFIRGEFASVLNAPMPTQESVSQSKINTGDPKPSIEESEDDYKM